MAENTHIEWTDDTWNPITGCSVVSPGCTSCYAMKLAGTRLRHHLSRAGLTVESKAGPVWNGHVRFNEQWLDQPMRRKRPRMIFVCAHGDLFHENVPDGWIDRVFAVMASSPQHTFQVLTKRSARLRRYLEGTNVRNRISAILGGFPPGTEDYDYVDGMPWPLPNVWLGVSAEDQARADERIPDLLATPAAVRFLSAEPLLAPIDLTALAVRDGVRLDALQRYVAKSLGDGHWDHRATTAPGLDWVIVGGESGQGARPMHPDWARSLRDQCSSAGVPFFFKQWGAWGPVPGLESTPRQPRERFRKGGPKFQRCDLDGAAMINFGKKGTGRLLDGVEHNGMPQPREVPAL